MGKKHPHVCGENVLPLYTVPAVPETPPRMWGERNSPALPTLLHRNTPTYVGRTRKLYFENWNQRKHPHVCGENAYTLAISRKESETPPRMWGELQRTFFRICVAGNTPTYVGRTVSNVLENLTTEKHPHVCGENLFKTLLCLFVGETPPRMWGEH